MTTYFASQAGAGAGDGSSPDDAWSIAGIDWSGTGFGGGGNTLYLLDIITSQILPAVGSDGVAGDPNYIRGDYPGRECTLTVSDAHAVQANGKDYIELTGITFSDCNSLNFRCVNHSGTPIQFNVSYCTFTNFRDGIYVNGSDNCDFHHNVFVLPNTWAGYAIRLFNAATLNNVYRNTITGDISGGTFQNAIVLDSVGTSNNNVFLNRIYNLDGDGVNLIDADSNNMFSNIFGPRIKECMDVRDSDSNNICNNYMYQDATFGTSYSTLTLSDNNGTGNPSDSNIVRNNIFRADGVLKVIRLGANGEPMGASNTIENNIYYQDGSTSSDNIIHFNNGVVNVVISFDTLVATYGYETLGYYENVNSDSNFKPSQASSAIGNGAKWWSSVNNGAWIEGYDGEPFSDFDTDIGAIQSTFGPFHPKNL